MEKNKMNKTNRKNQTDLIVNWPNHGEIFTFKNLLDCNKHFDKVVTLRSRLAKAIADKLVICVGTKNPKKGRPINVLAMCPVTKEFLESLYDETKPIEQRVQRPYNKNNSILDIMNVSLSTEQSTAESVDIIAPRSISKTETTSV